MTITTAVILAAGRGMRLGPLGRRMPKGLLRPDPRRPAIILDSIARLRSRGIRRIVLVTGHLRTFYDDLGARDDGLIVAHNPRFATSGSLYSLARAREYLASDILLLESDLVYETRALDAALQSPHADSVVVSGPTSSGDEVYVTARGERITTISKDPSLAPSSVGELVGICKLSPTLLSQLVALAAAEPSLEYETGGLARLAATCPIHVALVPDLLWAEIDTPTHFERVRRQIAPRLPPPEPIPQ